MSGFIDEGKKIGLAEAIFDNESDWQDELAFRRGDVLRVVDTNPAQGSAQGWWVCADQSGRCGIAPANRLKMLSEADFFRNRIARRSFDDFPFPNDYDFLRSHSLFDDPFFMNRHHMGTRLRNTGFVDDVDSLTTSFQNFRPLHDVNHPFKVGLSDQYKSADSSDIDEFMVGSKKSLIRNVPINIEARAPTPTNAKHHRPKSPPAPPLRRHLFSAPYLDPPSTNSSEEEELRNALSNRNVSWYDRLPANQTDPNNSIYSTLTSRLETGSRPSAKRVRLATGFTSLDRATIPHATNRRMVGVVQQGTNHVLGGGVEPTNRVASSDDVMAPLTTVDRNGNSRANDPFALYDHPPSLRKPSTGRAPPIGQNRVNRVRFAQNLENSPTDPVASPSHFHSSPAHFSASSVHVLPNHTSFSANPAHVQSSPAHLSSSPAPFCDLASSSDRSSNSTTVSSISDAVASTSSSQSVDGAAIKQSIDFSDDAPKLNIACEMRTMSSKDGATAAAKKSIDSPKHLDRYNAMHGPHVTPSTDYATTGKKSVENNLYDVPKSLSQLLNGLNGSYFSTDSSNLSSPKRINNDWERKEGKQFLDADYEDANTKSNAKCFVSYPHDSPVAYDDDYDFVDNSPAFKNVDVLKNLNANNVDDMKNVTAKKNAYSVENCDVIRNDDVLQNDDVIVKKDNDVIVRKDDGVNEDDDCVEIARFYAPQIRSQCERLGVAIDEFLASVEPTTTSPKDADGGDGSKAPTTAVAGQSMVRDVVSRARFLVLAAHKLVYLGDSLAHCAGKRSLWSSERAPTTVSAPCDRLCGALRRFVAATKRACAAWPRVDEARDMYDCVLRVSVYARELALASAQLAARG